MGKKVWVVSKPAEVWFSAEVEAESMEEAIAKAGHPTFDWKNWEMDMDSLLFVDGDWEAFVEGGEES